MQYRDISEETTTIYQLSENEEVVFFMHNRTGKITFELSRPGATLHVFAFMQGHGQDESALEIIQQHSAPDTTSSVLVKSALNDGASFVYNGTLGIEKGAHRSRASQESRALLLSPSARAESSPTLEILAHDVECRHAATTAPLNEDALFFATSRGLSQKASERLLVSGFFREALEEMEKLGVAPEESEKILNRIIA